MNSNSNGQRRPRIDRRLRTRPRRVLPPPITASAEVLAEALFSLPQHRTWLFLSPNPPKCVVTAQ